MKRNGQSHIPQCFRTAALEGRSAKCFSVRGILFVNELGMLLLSDGYEVLASVKYPQQARLQAFVTLKKGEKSRELEEIADAARKLSVNPLVTNEPAIEGILGALGFNVSRLEDEEAKALLATKEELILKARLAEDLKEFQEAVRQYALEEAEARIRQLSGKPDLQAMEAVLALDEVDKTSNLLTARIREWYGLHFPELSSFIEDPKLYSELVSTFKTRENFREEELLKLGISPRKAEALIIASERSKGGALSPEDAAKIASLAQEIPHLLQIRDKLAKHVENIMEKFCPNLAKIAGATIGARLLAKAGSVDRLARLPGSTIQILGAEKALFRALRTGAKPPKHGILFQHQAVHSAPKWQRGKIARSLASKIAIAARIDAFRGTPETGLEEKFERRLEEIRVKYREPPEKKVETKEWRKGARRGRARTR